MKLYQVDAFTKTLFRGNPAAVCLLSEAREDSWMQSLAQEMNLSETASSWLWRMATLFVGSLPLGRWNSVDMQA